jgi:hypothetical protein
MSTVVSAKWSVALPSQRLRLDGVVRSLGYVPSSRPPEARRALLGRSGLINQQCLATGHEEWDRTSISLN